MIVGIPRCNKTRWAEGIFIVCSAKLDLVKERPPRGTDPNLHRFICLVCGDFYWIHASILPLGMSPLIDAYRYNGGTNGTAN